ncbi:MAG: hypothetical protein AVDCRST_MAG35-2851 [uncultured Quadrisphaera sp.]|uniref:Uncharacterized protein n=1 Tax=uncultured Quadrisphaera sp. TaxID=904978 RepID=A0A6J4QA73_9ACTN|nr:MAG: hypothetical protein AVDCRST_MAG35-2851 [uncultured Quadrisphaera sp.]
MNASVVGLGSTIGASLVLDALGDGAAAASGSAEHPATPTTTSTAATTARTPRTGRR